MVTIDLIAFFIEAQNYCSTRIAILGKTPYIVSVWGSKSSKPYSRSYLPICYCADSVAYRLNTINRPTTFARVSDTQYHMIGICALGLGELAEN